MPDPRYRNCRLCPRACGVDRAAGRTGACGETADCRVASAVAHFGEEPCFTGARGSGTLFFSGCPSRCFFCQNHQISTGGGGAVQDADGLLALALALAEQGVHNLNFVSPDHFWPHVEALCRSLRARGVALPFLFNTSGYQDAGQVPAYAAWIDLFLPDFKFADAGLARRCMGDPRYPEIAMAAIGAMIAAKGFLDPWDPEGREPARRGVLVRPLVLPGCVANSLAAVRRLHEAFGPELPLSIMSQFRPMPGCRERGLFERTLRPEEYEAVTDLVERLGFERVFIQPLADDEAFVPDFRDDEPFPGNRNRPPAGAPGSQG